MNRRTLVRALALCLLMAACHPRAVAGKAEQSPPRKDEVMLTDLVERLVALHGESVRTRAQRGCRQLLALWRDEDGPPLPFVEAQFVTTPEALDALFVRMETVQEQLDGHLLEAGRALRWGSDVAGPLLPMDSLLASVDPGAHLSEDLFASKVAFAVLLNFPLTPLEQRLAQGDGWSRRRWAEDRLTARFRMRVPGEVFRAAAESSAQAELYISQYNLYAHHLLDADGARLFPRGVRLISHWGVRDAIKAAYADADGLARQRLLTRALDAIVRQTVPRAAIDNPTLDWQPSTGKVTEAPVPTREEGGHPLPLDPRPEPDTRYAQLLAQFHAQQRMDPYAPTAPTALQRAYEGAEIPEARLRGLLTEVVQAPQAAQVGRVIAQRLGRALEPHDLWYDGFNTRARTPEATLSQLTRARYPDAAAFAKDIPRILQALGFPEARARFVAEHIRVDAVRGAGHAMQAARRGDFPRLRTRIAADGMDYQGYNIAVHELGHNVEQVLSLYEIDHTLLSGVPNTAFTEALAFVFQARDLSLLGQETKDPEAERLRVLSTFWQTWEIAGVGLLDLSVWSWMYAHPQATPAELKAAVLATAQGLWDRYYAPVLGPSNGTLLAVYSHMISYPLYLFNYPLGHLIAFQIEQHLLTTKGTPLGVEFERMVKQGAVSPDVWMKHATGSPVSTRPLLDATARALGTEGRY